MLQLFQLPQWKLLVEYLLSERMNAVNDLVYSGDDAIINPKQGLVLGKIQMIDAVINLPEMVKLKLKEEVEEKK